MSAYLEIWTCSKEKGWYEDGLHIQIGISDLDIEHGYERLARDAVAEKHGVHLGALVKRYKVDGDKITRVR